MAAKNKAKSSRKKGDWIKSAQKDEEGKVTMEETDREFRLNEAVNRQGDRVRKRTYDDMKGTMRETGLLFRAHAKARRRESFDEAKEKMNRKTKKAIMGFSASDLPASSYIK